MKAIILSAMLVTSAAAAQSSPPAEANPAAPVPTPAPPATPEKKGAFKPTVKLSGLLVPQYFRELRADGASKIGADQFVLSRARIGARGKILPYLNYRVSYALESGTETIWDAIKDTYIEFTGLPNHEIRFGKFKTPFGYEQPESEVRLLPINRTYVTSALGRGEDSRDIGASAFGDWELGEVLNLEYAVAVVNGQYQDSPTNADDLPQKNVFVRAGLRAKVIGGTLTVRGSYSVGNASAKGTDEDRLHLTRFGGDLTWNHPYAWVASEFMKGTDAAVGGATTEKSGWYVVVGPRLPWSGGVTTVMVRYETYDKDAGQADDVRRRWTYGLVHDLNPKLRLMANFEQDSSDKAVEKPHKLIFQTLLSF